MVIPERGVETSDRVRSALTPNGGLDGISDGAEHQRADLPGPLHRASSRPARRSSSGRFHPRAATHRWTI